MKQFFADSSKDISVSMDDIIPSENASKSQTERACYRHYIDNLVFSEHDGFLIPFMDKAGSASLNESDFESINDYFESAKRNAISETDSRLKLKAYSDLKSLAMKIAQVLFLDNLKKEGFKFSASADLRDELRKYISSIVAKSASGERSDRFSKFHTELFIHQAAFDLYFVPKHAVGGYDAKTGEYRITDGFRDSVRYLDLCAIKEIKYTKYEKILCENLTTNWCKGITREVWDSLNNCYYSAISPTTGKPNLFTAEYDKLLEYMLPQWPYSRALLANEILLREDRESPLNVVEIGAGSGAIAIDLFMAAKKQKRDISSIDYHGIEPASFMRNNFASNIESRIGESGFPAGWKIDEGSLENFIPDFHKYCKSGKLNILVLSGTAHHVYPSSLKAFLEDENIKSEFNSVYILDVTERHGYTKPYYMWADCESPECFDNVSLNGIWQSTVLWEVPNDIVQGFDNLTNSWIRCRRLS